MLPDFRVRQRDYLLEIARVLAEELDLEKLLAKILNVSIELLAGQAGFIALKNEELGWQIYTSHGLPAQLIKYIEQNLSDVTDSKDQSGETQLSRINQIINELAHSGSFGYLNGVGIPLVARGLAIGIIYIFRSYSSSFSANDRILLTSFANQAAVAVQNAKLYKQVNQERQRISALLDTVADGILILSPSLVIERCNPAFQRMMHLPPEKIVENEHQDLIQWVNPPTGQTLEEAVAGGWPLTSNAHLYVEGDLKIISSNSKVPVGITYAPLVSENNKLLNIIATIRDITRFRQADELKSIFMSVISHELKTPVALIKGYVGTLRREDADWDRSIIEESLTVIEEEADHLGSLIDNMLDASRLQSGGIKIKRSDVNLKDLVERLAKKFQTQTDRHQVIIDLPANLPIILADENRLQHVISNLISNAIKYAPGGEIHISGQVRRDIIVICVSDEGPGIAMDDIPHIFDRFYRSPEISRNSRGAGLGLFLTRSIIEAHGGQIWVNPETGKGARICFSLPREADNLPNGLSVV